MDISCKILWTLTILCVLQFIEANGQDASNSDLLDEWVVKVNGGYERAKDFAVQHDLELIGQVGSLEVYYRFKLSRHRKRRMVDSDYEQFENDLKTHPDTLWLQRQTLLTRKKRDYIVDSDAFVPRSLRMVFAKKKIPNYD